MRFNWFPNPTPGVPSARPGSRPYSLTLLLVARGVINNTNCTKNNQIILLNTTSISTSEARNNYQSCVIVNRVACVSKERYE